jgi:hypothetical protein
MRKSCNFGRTKPKNSIFSGIFSFGQSFDNPGLGNLRGLAVVDERPLRIEDLARRFESWLPDYMAGSS